VAEDERKSHQKTASSAIHGKTTLAAAQTTFVQRFPRLLKDSMEHKVFDV
jgi:hypothetical protein